MVYLKKLVCVLKVNNQVLRETINKYDDIFINIPYGSEYSLHFKNQNDRDCAVQITIDGQDVLDGNMLIVRAGKTNQLEGYLKDYIVKNKFKFIEKTDRIKEYRGDKLDDGLIVIKFNYVKPINNFITTPHRTTPYYPPTYTCSSSDINSMNLRNCSFSCQKSCLSDDNGITVPGSLTEQKFESSYLGPLENNWETIIFKLLGSDNKGQIIEKPRTTNSKLKCQTCGKNHKSHLKFCSECGTSLI